MTYLEKYKVIHRDLALRNILLASLGQAQYLNVKVADFGLSRTVEDYYVANTNEFPIRWCAPETIRKRQFSSKTDVWSFGITIWELYSGGEIPYAVETMSDAAKMIVEGKILSRPQDCPEAVYQVMKHCWESTPSLRPSFLEIFEALNQLDV